MPNPSHRPRRTSLLPAPSRRIALAGGVTLALTALGRAALSQPRAAQAAPLVAVAASLSQLFAELAAAFAARSGGQQLRPSFGATGNFARQIAQGAPFELLLAADEESVLALHARGVFADPGLVFALGRLALFAPHGAPFAPDAMLADLGRALAVGAITRFAIANPAHAPYGRAAQQALVARGLWEAIGPRLVFGESVSAAAQFALSGNAQGALLPQSLVLAPRMAAGGRAALLDAALHAPLRHRMALARNASDAAREFYVFLQGAEAGAILARHGLSRPDLSRPAAD
ncbi:MAG: molybdate ABC transporter substrate-binding protein [Alphaproteobacteria bacterium]|nr:molybdate ABC transporter substrate-binding protein [Alphaproteobacteria bacterium]